MEALQTCDQPPEDQPSLLSLCPSKDNVQFAQFWLSLSLISYNLYSKDLSPDSLFWFNFEAGLYSEYPGRRCPRVTGSVYTSHASSQPPDSTTGDHTEEDSGEKEADSMSSFPGNTFQATIFPMDFHPGGSISNPGIEQIRKKPKGSRVLQKWTKSDFKPGLLN